MGLFSTFRNHGFANFDHFHACSGFDNVEVNAYSTSSIADEVVNPCVVNLFHSAAILQRIACLRSFARRRDHCGPQIRKTVRRFRN
jgi:hypothetical protein